MRKRIWVVAAAALALSAVSAHAQDPEDAKNQRTPIRVLRHPYDIASFYRSSGGPSSWTMSLPSDRSGGYALAARYRLAGSEERALLEPCLFGDCGAAAAFAGEATPDTCPVPYPPHHRARRQRR
jgi:hypothetical protein